MKKILLIFSFLIATLIGSGQNAIPLGVINSQGEVTGVAAPACLTDVNTTKGWYDFEVGVTLSGSEVTQWDDQSGNGNHLVGAASYRPDLTATGILFNGSSDQLRDVTMALSQPIIVYAVMIQVTHTNADYLFDVGAGVSVRQTTLSGQVQLNSGGSSFSQSGTPINSYAIYRILWNGASSKMVYNTTAQTGTVGADGGTYFRISKDGVDGGNMEVKEVIVRNTTDYEADILSYLNTKYSIY
ncbi:MAG: hypothetical protein UR43_C0015G0006 [candidate division TM6 bacterium GW2011_GWF2_33_332]|nr:MAG: hypothetical protein UR43_C0015G0006 [candidate division TM6 bacterium GW2011_GWF2_33_332]